MNTLVVYDSQFGNTEKIALQIAETLGEFGAARAVRVSEVKPEMLTAIELLVVGCPTQGWQSTPPVKKFISGLDRALLQHLMCAEFDTRLDKPQLLTGSAARGMEKQLRRLGATTFMPTESFLVVGTEGPLVEGELEHAAEWARLLHSEFLSEMQPAQA